MAKMKTLTVNGQTYTVDDADSASFLQVSAINNTKASHTAEQIYAHIQGGGVAFLYYLSEYWPLISASESEVVFGNTQAINGKISTVDISVDAQGGATVRNATVGGEGGGGVTVDEVIEELGKTRIPNITVDDAEVNQVLITQVGGEGIHVEHAGQNVLYFQETADSNDVILRGIAPGETDTDAVSKAQLDTALGDIESALDNIIAIQNTLIGGDEA